jgi:hypothetical protein
MERVFMEHVNAMHRRSRLADQVKEAGATSRAFQYNFEFQQPMRNLF